MSIRIVVPLCLAAACAAFGGCGGKGKPAATPPVQEADLRDEIPPSHLGEVLAANRLGIGHLERFEYAEAGEQFRIVRRLAPGWVAGSINLAIALLNDSGTKAEKQKESGAQADAFASNFDEALSVLDSVIRRQPKNLHAHYCRGIILEYLQADPNHPENLVRSNDDFRAVVAGDPGDANAWYKVAMTLYDPKTRDDPEGARPFTAEQLPEKIQHLERALAQNPYLVPALYDLHLSHGRRGDRATQNRLIARFQRLNPSGNAANPGEMVANFYGDQGRYARAIDPAPTPPDPGKAALPPRFDPPRPIAVKLADGDRWARRSDFTGKLAVVGRVRDRFGAAASAFDADGDGKLDLYLAAAVAGPKGVRDVLLINKGDGTFDDRTEAFGLPLDRASLGVAAADFDADRRVDLFLTGVGDNRLFRNGGKPGFVDVTAAAGLASPAALSLTARWMDLDQDGDLDLYVINYTKAEHADEAFARGAPPGLANAAYRNDGKPPRASTPENNWAPLATTTAENAATEGLSLAFSPWTDSAQVGGGDGAHTGIALLDVDDDRDIDLVLTRDDQPPLVLLNDRLGAFRAVPLEALGAEPTNGLLAADLDKDGQVDLVAVGHGGKVSAWRNATPRSGEAAKLAFAAFPSDARDWRLAVAADLDLDTWTDLVGIPAGPKLTPPAWERNLGTKLVPQPLALVPDGEGASVGMLLADVAGDALPDLLTVRDGEAPRLAVNRGNGHRWVALGLGGRWKTSHDQMRTNSEGLGTRITIEGEGLDVEYSHTTPDSGLAQSAAPLVLGLGPAKEVTLLHLRWPDGVLQCELNLPTDTLHSIAEYNRKTGSCPVLFTWNGARFECLGDFLGGGGLGYLVAPGAYGQPDRDESVAIAPEQLRAVDGAFRLSITEPMDEIAYLDRLTLEVVDRPPGVRSTPDERFAPEGPRPSGTTFGWSQAIEPIKATDHSGRDLTETLKSWDRKTADGFRRLRGWIGYAEEHAITLDFGDRLARYRPGDRLMLCLAGWVEYPYSQTNYAASTAGTALQPPVLERLGDDGTWTLLDPHPGYPAGLPRMMTVDLTGKVAGPRCVLRLRTNMECYWDQAFVAVVEDPSRLRTTTLDVVRARLGYRGYMREVSPDGSMPLLYDYEYVDPAPLARLKGNLTRYGDVVDLLRADDDRLCLVGPGDEVRLEFDSVGLPTLAAGWTRSYVLRAVGYCKDADPFTATSDRVGPLPWKGMPAFPFRHGETRPTDRAYEDYLRDYQTRPAATR